MSNRSNRPGTELTYDELVAIISLGLLSETPSGYHLAKDSTGGIVNTPDSGGGAGDMEKAVYDPANIAEQLVGETATQTLTGKTLDNYTNFIHADGIHLRVKATENLVRGDVIKFVGFNSGEQAIEVAKRDLLTVPAIGVLDEDLAIGEFGMAVSNGLFKNIDTSAFTEGSVLYPNATGWFTTTPDISDSHYNQQLAYVVRSHAINGEIMLNVGAGHDIANQVAYDNTVSGLVATNVKDALDEIVTTPSVLGLTSDDIVANSGVGGSTVTEDLDILEGRVQNLETKKTWADLAVAWETEPTLNTTLTDGEVYNYTYTNLGTLYRFVPSTYDPTLDIFYQDFDGTNLTTPIAARNYL